VFGLKTIIICFLALAFSILFFAKPISAATTAVIGCAQLPKPQIVHPADGSNIIRDGIASGTVAITIYIEPVAITSMEVYAIETAQGKISFVGLATRDQSSSDYIAPWKTGGYRDGVYQLIAKAKIYCSPDIITVASNPIGVTLATSLSGGTTSSNPPSSSVGASPTPQSSTSPSSIEPAQISKVVNPKGEVTQQLGDNNTIRISAIDPKTLISYVKPSSIILAETVSGSEIISAITFTQDLNKNTRLEKIENRRDKNKQKFLLFTGHSKANSRVTISINSEEPIVIYTTSDSSGNWTYTFEKPLEPGKHKVVIEVGQDEAKETAGPYFFSIARAQASADNPTGASLNLVDPNQSIKNYLLIAGALVLIGIGIMVIIRLQKRDIFNPSASAPTKAI